MAFREAKEVTGVKEFFHDFILTNLTNIKFF